MSDYTDEEIGTAIDAAEADGNKAAAEELRGMLSTNKKWGGSLDVPAAGEGFQSAATMGFADEIGGALQAAVPHPERIGFNLDAFRSDPGEPGFFDRYAKWRDAKRAEQDAAWKRSPGSMLLGGLAGGVVTVPAQMSALGAIPKVGAALKSGGIISQGAKAGATLGGVAGLGGSAKDSAWGTTKDVAGGAALGGALGALGSALGQAARPGKIASTSELGEMVSTQIAQNEGRAPIIEINRIPGQARESAAVIDAIKQAAKSTKVETTPAGASEFLWTTSPQGQNTTMGVRPMQAETTSTMAAGPPIEIPGKAALVLPRPGNRSPDATLLMKRGAKLTVGQQNPTHEVAQVEEASTSLPGQGQSILGQRAAGNDSVRNVALNAARAPGAPRVPPSGDLWNDVTKVADGYDRAYEAFRGIPVYPAVHGPGGGPLQGTGAKPGLMEQALDAVEGITDDARAVVKGKVLNELTRLPERKGAVGQVDLGDLLKVRSTVRTEIRKLARGGDTAALDRKAAYEVAEEVLGAAIDSQIAGETGQALRAVDAGYRNYKMVEHAMEMAGTRPGGFTPNELAAGIKLATSKGGWARGHTEEMWEIAKAWRAVTQQITPPTGARAVVLDMMPGGAKLAKLRAQAIISANENVLRSPAK